MKVQEVIEQLTPYAELELKPVINLEAVKDGLPKRIPINPQDGYRAKIGFGGIKHVGNAVCFEIEINEGIMGIISCEMEKLDRARDVKQYLEDLYAGDNIPAWQYEYLTRKPEMMEKILQLFDKLEDCNTPFNTTIDIVIERVMKEVVLDDEKLEYLWEEFGDVLIDDDECILDDFLGFECGTRREEVWHWFDERYSGGVAKLMHSGVPRTM